MTKIFDMRPFGVTFGEIDAKKFNIFIGISIGNKFLNTALAKKYLAFALDHTAKNVLVLIGDSIDAINWVVYNDFDEVTAARKAKGKGQQFDEMFKRATSQLAHERHINLDQLVSIVRWNDIVNPAYLLTYNILKHKFEEEIEFRLKVFFFVDAYAARRGRRLSDSERIKLSDYVISELPTLLYGVEHADDHYDLILYPTFKESGMSQFVLDIHAGKYGPLGPGGVSEPRAAMIEIITDNTSPPLLPQEA
jgi:tRNA-dependent cyclodipeptide synthase